MSQQANGEKGEPIHSDNYLLVMEKRREVGRCGR